MNPIPRNPPGYVGPALFSYGFRPFFLSGAAWAAIAAALDAAMVRRESSVILMDVLGYSLEEIRGITASSIPAVKPPCIAGASGCARRRRSRTTLRRRSSARPTMHGLRPMWTGSCARL